MGPHGGGSQRTVRVLAAARRPAITQQQQNNSIRSESRQADLSVAVSVVVFSFLRVLERLVCFADLLERLLGLGGLIFVRVKFQCHFFICALDVVVARRSRNTQYLVVIHHALHLRAHKMNIRMQCKKEATNRP